MLGPHWRDVAPKSQEWIRGKKSFVSRRRPVRRPPEVAASQALMVPRHPTHLCVKCSAPCVLLAGERTPPGACVCRGGRRRSARSDTSWRRPVRLPLWGLLRRRGKRAGVSRRNPAGRGPSGLSAARRGGFARDALLWPDGVVKMAIKGGVGKTGGALLTRSHLTTDVGDPSDETFALTIRAPPRNTHAFRSVSRTWPNVGRILSNIVGVAEPE